MSVPKISKVHQAVLSKQAEKIANAVVTGAAIPKHLKERPLPTNNFWDEVENHYKLASQAIVKVDSLLLSTVEDVLSDEQKVARITAPEDLSRALTTLNKDLTAHVDRLNAIHEQHKDKTGSADLSEIEKVLNLYTQYAEAAEIYDGNIVPTHAQILDILGCNEEVVDAIIIDSLPQPPAGDLDTSKQG